MIKKIAYFYGEKPYTDKDISCMLNIINEDVDVLLHDSSRRQEIHLTNKNLSVECLKNYLNTQHD